MTKQEISDNFWSAFKLIWAGVALLALAAILVAFAYFSPAILAGMAGYSLIVGFPLIAIVGALASVAAIFAPIAGIAGLATTLVNVVRTFMWAFEKPTEDDDAPPAPPPHVPVPPRHVPVPPRHVPAPPPHAAVPPHIRTPAHVHDGVHRPVRLFRPARAGSGYAYREAIPLPYTTAAPGLVHERSSDGSRSDAASVGVREATPRR